MNPYGSLCSTSYKTLVFNLRIILRSHTTPRDITSIYQSCYHTNPVHRSPLYPREPTLRSSKDNLHTLNTLKMSDVAMDTPADSQTSRGTNVRANKPDTYYSDRNKLEA